MSIPKAQSVAEYSICVVLVAAALLGMQHLVRTSLAGKYKDLADFTTKQAASSAKYTPYYVQDNYRVLQSKNTDEKIQARGVVDRDFKEDDVSVKGTAIRNVQ